MGSSDSGESPSKAQPPEEMAALRAELLAIRAERDRLQAALLEAETLLDKTQKAAGIGSFVWKLGDDSLSWSRHMFAMAGLDPAQFSGNLRDVMARLIHPDDLPDVASQIEAMVCEKRTWPMEFRVIRPDGEIRWWRSSSEFTFDERGEIVGAIGVHFDVTERKQAEAALAAERNLLRTLIGALPDWVYVKDLEGRYIVVNQAMARGLGLSSPAELTGKRAHDVHPPELAEMYHRRDAEVLRTGQPSSVFEPVRLASGETREFMTIKVPLRDEQGAIIGLVGTGRDVTELRRAEAERDEQRRLLRAIIDATPDIIIYRDADLVYRLCNQALLRHRGLPMDQVIGKTDHELFPAAFADVTQAEDRCVLEHQQPLRVERRDENVLGGGWFEISKAPVFDDAGQATGLVVLARDVTERKQAEAALAAERNLLRTLIDALPDWVYVKDLDGRYLMVNEAMAREVGYDSPAGLIGRHVGEVFPQPVATKSRQHDRDVVQTGKPVTMLETVQRPSGETQELLTIKVPLRDAQGALVGIVGASRDITELRQAERALRESEEKYRLLAETANDLIIAYDLNGHVTYINPAGLRLTGYSLEEALQMNVMDVVAPECVEDVRQRFARRAAGDMGRYLYELVFFTKAGERAYLEISSAPLVRDGQVVGMLAVGRNLTERRRLEEQLRQAQKMETVGRLAGGVAHDFNNLLTAILGYSSFVQAALPPEDPVQRDMAEIVRAAERAARLTAQLLAFSRRQMMQFRPLDLNELILDMGRMLRRLIGEDIELAVLPAPDLDQVNADRSQLEQVLINLAVNARDAMPQGGALTIRTANVTLSPLTGQGEGLAAGEGSGARSTPIDLPPGDYVLLSVADTGCGMDAEVMSHLFEPFFTTKEVGKGTGLGLATVYGIIKQHGGDIQVRSEPGRGTTFNIYLSPLTTAVAHARPAVGKETLPRGNERILLVEDEPTVRATLARMLRGLGYAVWEAGTGEEALRLVQTNALEPDLLVTDVVMPRMGGRELADRLAVACSACRVLFMSGYTDDAILRHGVTERRAAFLEKPFGLSDLARKVRAVLDDDEGRAAAPLTGAQETAD